MPGPKPMLSIRLSEAERQELQGLLRRPTAPAGVVRRARAILLLADGAGYSQVGRQVGMARHHLRKWVRRFDQQRLDGLDDAPRPGRKPVFSPQGGGARGQAGLRDARPRRPLAVSVGLC